MFLETNFDFATSTISHGRIESLCTVYTVACTKTPSREESFIPLTRNVNHRLRRPIRQAQPVDLLLNYEVHLRSKAPNHYYVFLNMPIQISRFKLSSKLLRRYRFPILALRHSTVRRTGLLLVAHLSWTFHIWHLLHWILLEQLDGRIKQTISECLRPCNFEALEGRHFPGHAGSTRYTHLPISFLRHRHSKSPFTTLTPTSKFVGFTNQ